MRVLLDTNILLRLAEPGHPMHRTTVKALFALQNRGDDLCIVPQNHYEFWAVATRTAAVEGGKGGLGFTPEEAATEIHSFRESWTLLGEASGTLDAWVELVTQHRYLGKSAHDAHLVAAMAMHGIPAILTFNVRDFRRYAGVEVLDPATL